MLFLRLTPLHTHTHTHTHTLTLTAPPGGDFPNHSILAALGTL